jgi:hypothetical protein
MKYTFALYTKTRVELNEFINDLKKLEVLYEKNGADFFQGRYSKGLNHVWIYDDDTVIENYTAENTIGKITNKLGSEPKSCFVLEANSGPLSKNMVLEMAKHYANNHNCVLELDDNLSVLNQKEILSTTKLTD